jgi:hypothetical protein
VSGMAASGSTYDLYIWASPRELDAETARERIRDWQAGGGDPADAPFAASTDIGWFHRELVADLPDLAGLNVASDAVPSGRRTPVWMSGTDEAPARVVALRLPESGAGDVLAEVIGLAAKYDLLVYDARNEALHRPLDLLAAHASATFWPGGAIRAAVAGAVGLAIAAGAWVLSIPVLSGALVVVGAFVVLMSVLTFVHEGRVALRSRRG